MRERIRPGDVYRVPLCTTSDSRIARDVEVTIDQVERLGCGCTRLTTPRPGPTDGPLASAMDLTVNRCAWHAANPLDGAAEPTRVTA